MSDPNSSPVPLAAKLAKAFRALAIGLTFTSESDYPYQAFSAEMTQTTDLTPETFRVAEYSSTLSASRLASGTLPQKASQSAARPFCSIAKSTLPSGAKVNWAPLTGMAQR